MKNIFLSLYLLSLLTSCLGIAKVADFETDATTIDFDKHALTYQEESYNQKIWTFKTADDYYFELPLSITEEAFTETTKEAFTQHKYYRLETDLVNNRVLGHRGLRANEWNSIRQNKLIKWSF